MLNPNPVRILARPSTMNFKTSYVKSKLGVIFRILPSSVISKHHMLNPNQISQRKDNVNSYFKTSYVKSKPSAPKISFATVFNFKTSYVKSKRIGLP